jgi:hypothetical protein
MVHSGQLVIVLLAAARVKIPKAEVERLVSW